MIYVDDQRKNGEIKIRRNLVAETICGKLFLKSFFGRHLEIRVFWNKLHNPELKFILCFGLKSESESQG